jgi:hypothetical protein
VPPVNVVTANFITVDHGKLILVPRFMQSDPWWSLAMAVNVYMVFFMSYPPNDFHKHLWLYCVVCFGIPAVPAFICLFYEPNRERMYGNATVSRHNGPTYMDGPLMVT